MAIAIFHLTPNYTDLVKSEYGPGMTHPHFSFGLYTLMMGGGGYWGLTPQQQPGSYQGGEMTMKSVFWWRKPEYPEETTDLRQKRRGGGKRYSLYARYNDEKYGWSLSAKYDNVRACLLVP